MNCVKVQEIVKREIDVEDLPDRLQKALDSSGMSVSALCRAVDVSRTYWYRLVNDKEEVVAMSTLRKIEQALGVDLGVRFTSEGDEAS